MALSGSLSDFSFADILTLVSQQRKSGSISLTHGRQKAKLVLKEGQIVSVMVGGRTPESIVRDALIFTGKVESRDFSNLENISKKTSTSLSDLLYSKGLFSQNEKENWFKIAAEDLALELFSWNNGKYQFVKEDLSSDYSQKLYQLSPDFLSLEGMRQLDEWPNLEKQLPDKRVVFSVVKSDYADYELGQDLYVMEVIGKGSPLYKIERSLPFGRFRLYGSLINLWNEGFLQASTKNTARSEPVSSKVVQITGKPSGNWIMALSVLILATCVLIRFTLYADLPYKEPLFQHIRSYLLVENIRISHFYLTLQGSPQNDMLKEMERTGILSKKEISLAREIQQH